MNDLQAMLPVALVSNLENLPIASGKDGLNFDEIFSSITDNLTGIDAEALSPAEQDFVQNLLAQIKDLESSSSELADNSVESVSEESLTAVNADDNNELLKAYATLVMPLLSNESNSVDLSSLKQAFSELKQQFKVSEESLQSMASGLRDKSFRPQLQQLLNQFKQGEFKEASLDNTVGIGNNQVDANKLVTAVPKATVTASQEGLTTLPSMDEAVSSDELQYFTPMKTINAITKERIASHQDSAKEPLSLADIFRRNHVGKAINVLHKPAAMADASKQALDKDLPLSVAAPLVDKPSIFDSGISAEKLKNVKVFDFDSQSSSDGNEVTSFNKVLGHVSPNKVNPDIQWDKSVQPQQQNMTNSLQSKGWSEEISHKIQWLANQQVKTANIVLKPESLGTIEAQIRLVDSNKMEVILTSQHHSVRNALEQALPQLKEMFHDSDMSLSRVIVADQNTSLTRQDGQAAQQQMNQQQNQFTSNQESSTAPQETAAQTLQRQSDSVIDYYA